MSNSKALRTCTHINRNEWASQTGQSVLRPPLCTTASALMNPLNLSVSSLQWLIFSCWNIWSVDFHRVDRGAIGTFTPGVQPAACLSHQGCFRVQHLHKSAVSVSWIRKHFESLMEIQIPHQPVGFPYSHLTRCVRRGEKPWYKGHYLVFQLRVWKSENTTPQIKSITIF